MSPRTAPRTPRTDLAPAAALLAVAVLVAFAPALTVLVQLPVALSSAPSPATSAESAIAWPSVALILRSFGIALGIAALATLSAWPAAFALAFARRPAAWFVLTLAPVLLPPYLASAAWGLLRAPGTPIGDALLRAAADGQTWAPVFAGRVTAVFALAIWSWPLAAVIIALRLRETDADALDAARLEARPRRAAVGLLAPPLARASIAAAGMLAVLMLGSAIPLHVAQFETVSLRAWTLLTLLPPSQHAAAWLAAWPAFLAAALAAVLATRAAVWPSARRADAPHQPRRAQLRSRWPAAAALLIWALAVVVPLILFTNALEELASVPRTLQLDLDAWLASARASIAPGLIAVCITLATWHGLSTGARLARRLTAAAITLLAFTALAPGILIAAAIARFAAVLPIDPTAWALAAAHVARFGFVAALLGCALAAVEPAWKRDLRCADGARSLRALAASAGPAAIAVPLAAGVLVALLSFHEIEAAVLLTPPGRGALARTLLDRLHYARQEDLSAACLILAAVASFVGLLALAAMAAFRPRRALRGGSSD